MRKTAALITTLILAATPAAAMADPDFGPGNSSKGPQDGKCHTAEHGVAPSPNQDSEPGCKGN